MGKNKLPMVDMGFLLEDGLNVVDTSFLKGSFLKESPRLKSLGFQAGTKWLRFLLGYTDKLYTTEGVLREVQTSADWAEEESQRLKNERPKSGEYVWVRGKRHKKVGKARNYAGQYIACEKEFRKYGSAQRDLIESLRGEVLDIPNIPMEREFVEHIFRKCRGCSNGGVDQELILAALMRGKDNPVQLVSADIPQLITYSFCVNSLGNSGARIYDAFLGESVEPRQYLDKRRKRIRGDMGGP